MKCTVALSLALLSAAPAIAKDAYPVTVPDGRGAEVTLDAQPKRVAALWNAAADTMVALDLPVAGITTYEGKRPVYLGNSVDAALDLGDITAPNLELLATSDFDLTIGMTHYNAPYAEEIEQFSKFLSYESLNLDVSLASVASMGKALGQEASAEALNTNFVALIDEMKSQVPAKPQSTLFIWSFQNVFYGYQENLMTTELIAKLGAVNPLGRNPNSDEMGNAFIILEAEDLLKHDPDVIMMFVSHGGDVAYNPAYERLKAYKNNRIYSVGYQYSQPSGPIARELVLREAAHLIWPDTFDAPDMPEAARAVPVEFTK